MSDLRSDPNPDDWYESRADDLAGAEGEFHSACGKLIDAMQEVISTGGDLQEAVAPLGRHSSSFPAQMNMLAREAWLKALDYDKIPRDALVVRFTPWNQWRRIYDLICWQAQSCGITIKPWDEPSA